MKKKFTQLFSLRSFLSACLTLGMVWVLQAQCDVDPPAGALYSTQFDGGLDGWTATDLDGNPSDNWKWEPDGKVAGGGYNSEDGNNDFLISPSVCNGAMVFNSDFLDNNGIPNNFGQGDCPSTNPDGSFAQFCDGLLTSPVIDLSGATTEVALQFNQGVRQFNSEYYIYLSNDGGLSYYDTIQINADLPTNSPHILDDVQKFPLCGAKGVSEFVMTFHYRGNYYYWALDDIAIVPDTFPDVRTNENFFAVSPQFGTPYNMVFEMPFLSDIENVSATLAPAPELTVTVTDNSGAVLHTQTRTYDDVPGCMTDENKVFPETYTPPNTPEAMGRYRTTYVINGEGDLNPSNDTVTGVFDITERSMQKVLSEEDFGSEYLGGIRYGGGSYQTWGQYFYFPNNDLNQAIETIHGGIVPPNNGQVTPGNIEIAVYRWEDVNGDGDPQANERVKLGSADYFVDPSNTDLRHFQVTPLTEDDEMIIPEAGDQILVLFHNNPFDGNINYFSLNSDAGDIRSFSYSAAQLAYSELGLPPRYCSFGAVGTTADDAEDRDLFRETRWTWYINMDLTAPSGTEDINENLAINVYPSPASRVLNVSLDLDNLSEKVSVEMVDMKGLVIMKKEYNNIQKDVLSINVEDIPGGMYMLNVRTEDGMQSKKVSVIH